MSQPKQSAISRPTSEEFPESDFAAIAADLGLERDDVQFTLHRSEDSTTHSLVGVPRYPDAT